MPSDELAGDMRLYLLLALFDRRDGTYTADLVRSAREGYERDGMGEDGAWAEFDRLWDSSDSTGRLDAVKRDYGPADLRDQLVELARAWRMQALHQGDHFEIAADDLTKLAANPDTTTKPDGGRDE